MTAEAHGSTNAAREGATCAEVFRLIDAIAKRLRSSLREAVGGTNLTVSQYLVLNLLWEQDGRPFSDLALGCCLTRSTITGVIDTMERKGLVTRHRNPADRRSILVRLSDKGRGLKRFVPPLETVFKRCCFGVDPGELKQLHSVLKRLDER